MNLWLKSVSLESFLFNEINDAQKLLRQEIEEWLDLLVKFDLRK